MQTIVAPEDGGVSFKIFSSGAIDDGWRLHASGRARRADVDDAFTDLDGIRARCRDEVGAESHYALLGERGLDFGPSLRGLRRLGKGADELLAEVVLADPQAAEIGAYRVHPALLDACIQGLADVVTAGDATYLPISIDRVTLHALTAWGGPAPTSCSTPERPSTTVPRRWLPTSPCSTSRAACSSLSRASISSALAARRSTRLARQDPFATWLHEIAWRPMPAVRAGGEGAVSFPATTVLASQAGRAGRGAPRGALDRSVRDSSSTSWRR